MKSTKIFIIFTFLLAFAVSVSAQNLYPNELKEYKLFGNEKLKTLKIGISTRADVNKIFDSDCQYECDFNQNWTIKFKFFSKESESPLSYLANINLKPKSKYIGKLFSIIFMPKSVISFENIKLPKVFNHIGGIGVTTKNSSGSTDISSQKYRDNYGLQYEVQYETPLTDSGKEILKERKARLESIEYGASNALVRKMFIRAK